MFIDREQVMREVPYVDMWRYAVVMRMDGFEVEEFSFTQETVPEALRAFCPVIFHPGFHALDCTIDAYYWSVGCFRS